MPRHKSEEKHARKSQRANAANRINRTKLKTAVCSVLDSKDKTSAQSALVGAASVLDKSVKTGLIHRNKAANKKSSLAKFVNSLK